MAITSSASGGFSSGIRCPSIPTPLSFLISRLSTPLPTTIGDPLRPPLSSVSKFSIFKSAWASLPPWQPAQFLSRTGATESAKEMSPGFNATASMAFTIGAVRTGGPAAAPRASMSSGVAGLPPSNAAPASIQRIKIPTSAGETFPPPRGMSPLRITSTRRLAFPTPRCTMPDFINIS